MDLLRAFSSFPIFSPTPTLTPSAPRSTTEIRLSRWNNANAETFRRRLRDQQQVEQDLRRHRLYDSATRLTDVPDSPTSGSPPEFRSQGTPSTPSSPSIPGKKSKYSKPSLNHERAYLSRRAFGRTPRNPKSSDLSHPAFRSVKKSPHKLVKEKEGEEESAVRVGENGISYRLENAPFEFQYSYTETPKVRPLGLREMPYLPFGPTTMPRPWTGRAPLPASKKQLPEFDSFKLPPPGKKGVKPVQNPGPFLAGSGPKYHAKSREEVLGEALTDEEVKGLVQGCMKTTRQLNIGRDGLTHNMLDNIHAHWKRRRVCKIKCKGVCTVDMDNVCQQLEEKTGGKVIYSRGGVLFLFRGRNYNYMTHPRFPLMLWKPSPPIYPRLVQRVPEGLTLEEVTEMRKKGRELPPICKLAKNGVYINLVEDVKEAFEECELVRVNCKGLNKSDCRKIGAKLKDLVPCVLISFEYEHILMWRGKDWRSSLQPPEPAANISAATSLNSVDAIVNHQDSEKSHALLSLSESDSLEAATGNPVLEVNFKESEEDSDNKTEHQLLSASYSVSNYVGINHENLVSGTQRDVAEFCTEMSLSDTGGLEVPIEDISLIKENGSEIQAELETENPVFIAGPSRTGINMSSATQIDEHRTSLSEAIPTKGSSQCQNNMLQRPYLDGVMLLLKHAVENGSAVILDETALDADIVYERAVALTKTAPSGPIFKHHIRKPTKEKVAKVYDVESDQQDIEVQAVGLPKDASGDKRKQKKQSKDIFKDGLPAVVPHGNLKVDELAKLLA